jgi:glycosyltransferase involved in cell wall biosynthesis
MKIAFLCPSVSRTSGGIFEIERRLAQSLALIPGVHLEVFGPADAHSEADSPNWHPLKPRSFAYTGPTSFCYSTTMRDAFLSSTADVAHIHALWMYNSILAVRWAKKNNRPYVLTPNGMLEPWALRNSGWKKRLATLLYERRMLCKAACIQANTGKEAADIRAFGLKNPIAIIPNGIDLPVLENIEKLKSDGRKILLYLGRIHPKKGLANLLRGWAAVNQKSKVRSQKSEEWILAIAGWDQGGHEDELKRLATELGIAWADVRGKAGMRKGANARGEERETDFSASEFQNFSVLFLGPQFGKQKAALYRDCDAFILPSVSEGLPMVILEAWAYGKPVLMTPECNLPEGFAASAAVRIEPTVESIANGLHDLHQAPDSKLQALGANGRALVTARFTWPKIASDMKSVYDWVLGGGIKPDCVQIN